MRNLVPGARAGYSRMLFFLCLILISAMLQLSCTKNDLSYAKPPAPDREEVFFRVPDEADPFVQRIVQSLHIYHEKSGFVDMLPANAGLPVWKKLQIKKMPGMLSRGDSTESIIVPLTENNANLSSIIIAKPLGNDEYSIDYHGAAEMNAICNAAQPDVHKAERELVLFMLMENHTWGTTEFYHIPRKLLPQIPGKLQHDNKKMIELASLPGQTNNIAFPGCVLIPSGVHHPGEEGGCDWKTGCEYCSAYYCTTETPPTTPAPPGPTQPPTGGGGPTGGGSGGGCASCPVPPPTIPCDEPFYLVDPCDPPGDRDEHGFLYDRIQRLNTELVRNSFLFEPCDSLEMITLATYGPMYQRVAQFTSSATVIARLDSIRRVQGGWIVDDFNIQSLQEAYGPVVNCDYFPIKIAKMPSLAPGAPQMTPGELLEYFRMNINYFITVGNTYFTCALNAHIIDCPKWNQFQGNALGALNHINIFGNDGSVILSDYQHIYNPGSEQHYFKFSTLETPTDNEHPVAGNREFGIFSTPSNQNQYTFYTLAVDRTWDWITAVANSTGYGFEMADEMWSNIQQNFINFINQNGGNATYYARKNYIARPKWEEAKDYLLGNIDFQTFKQRIGCP